MKPALMPKQEKPIEKKRDAESKIAQVFILDDHPVLRHGLTQLINHQVGLQVCGEASTSDEALIVMETLKADIAVVDIALGGADGLEFIKTMKAQNPDILFLVHSMHDETLYAERALRAGARGYIMKQESAERVILAIRRILSGQIYMSDAMTEKMLERRYNGSSSSLVPMETLSDRELEVFQLIGRGETTVRIAKLLHRSVKTIETYRSRIKEKLNLNDNMHLIRHAMQSIYTEGPSKVEKSADLPQDSLKRKIR